MNPTTLNVQSVLDRAAQFADQLEEDMHWVQHDGYRGYWTANHDADAITIQARTTAATAFLAQFSGESSRWTQDARASITSHGGNRSPETGTRGVAVILRQWVDAVHSGFSEVRLPNTRSARTAASTDLLDQVRSLLADRTVHPAAAVVLAGAALEIALRNAVEELGLDLGALKPSIDTYATTLRRQEAISKQDVKDIAQIGGLRNEAAHGDLEFTEINRQRASLMEQQVNLLLGQLPGKITAALGAVESAPDVH